MILKMLAGLFLFIPRGQPDFHDRLRRRIIERTDIAAAIHEQSRHRRTVLQNPGKLLSPRKVQATIRSYKPVDQPSQLKFRHRKGPSVGPRMRILG